MNIYERFYRVNETYMKGFIEHAEKQRSKTLMKLLQRIDLESSKEMY